MSKTKIYANDIVLKENFHPGELIKDEIEARGIKQQELADEMIIAKNVMSELIHGKRNLTPLLALKLEAVLGIKAEFWMKLQVNYDINLIRNQYSKLIHITNVSPAKKAKLSTAVHSTTKAVIPAHKQSSLVKSKKVSLVRAKKK